MTNTDIKIRLKKILVRNEQRKANKLIPADILDIKNIIKQLSICDVVGQSEQLVCDTKGNRCEGGSMDRNGCCRICGEDIAN